MKACISKITFALILVSASAARANVIGAGTQNFNATPDGLDFVTVQSAYTLDPFIINTGLFFNYAINSLPYFDSNSQGHLQFNDTLLSGELNVAMGLLPNWEVGFSVPAVLAQTVDDGNALHGYFDSKGLAEYRLNTKYRVWGNDRTAVALIATVNFDQIRNNPYAGAGAGPTFNLEAAIEHKPIDRLAIALNIGHRWRNSGNAVTPLIEPLKDQLIASIGASYLLTWVDTKLIAEIYTGWPTQHTSSQSNRANSSGEFLLGIKHDFTSQLAFHAGATTELKQGVASPDYRIYTGINYAFGPVYKPATATDPIVVTPVAENAPTDDYIAPITFDFNSNKMNGQSEEALNKLADQLRAKAWKHLLIEGHTDSVGKVSYNVALSQRRADSIKTALITQYKFDGSKIDTSGIGPARPIADNGNYQGRQKNRRVEFKVGR